MRRPAGRSLALVLIVVVAVGAALLLRGTGNLRSDAGRDAGEPLVRLTSLTASASSPAETLLVGSAIGGRPAVGVVDVESGEATATRRPPFEHALFAPDALWSEPDFIVLGTPCEAEGRDGGDALPACDPGGLEIASYSPDADEWSSIAALPAEAETVASARLVGTYGSTVVVMEATGRVFAVDRDDGSWAEIPPAPVQPARACLVGGILVVVSPDGRPLASGGEVDRSRPLAASLLDISGDQEWSPPVGTGAEHGASDHYDLVCSSRGVLAVPVGSGSGGSYELRPELERWLPVPDPPQPIGVILASVATPGATTMWTDQMRATMSADGVWTTEPDPGTAVRASLVDGARATVVRSDQSKISVEEIPAG